MIITRTPLRISIGGGGTDLPSYYRKLRRLRHRRGHRTSTSTSAINETFSGGYFLKYSSLEHAAHHRRNPPSPDSGGAAAPRSSRRRSRLSAWRIFPQAPASVRRGRFTVGLAARRARHEAQLRRPACGGGGSRYDRNRHLTGPSRKARSIHRRVTGAWPASNFTKTDKSTSARSTSATAPCMISKSIC